MNTNDLGLAVKSLIERVMTLESQRDEMQKDLEGLTNAVLYLAHQLDEIYRIALEIEEQDLDLAARRRRWQEKGREIIKAGRRHH